MGSAGGAGFGDFAMQGMQLGQNQQRLDLVKAQDAMEAAMMPAKSMLMKQETELNALKLAEALKQRQERVDATKAYSEASSLVSQALKSGKPDYDAITASLFDVAAKNPVLGQFKPFEDLLKQVEVSQQWQIRKDIKEFELEARKFQPGFGTALNPVTGKPEAYFQGSPGSAQLVSEKASADPVDIRVADEITNLQNQIEATTDPVAKVSLQRRLSNIQAQTAKTGTTIFDPATGKPLVQIGGKQPNGAPAGLQAEVTGKVVAQKRLVEGLQGLMETGADQFFGPAAKLSNLWYDKLYSNVAPGTADPTRIQAFQKNNELRSAAIRALTDDKGQLSEGDQRRVAKLFPAEGIFNGSPSEARALWDGLINSAKGNARRLGESIGDIQLWAYTDEELASLPRMFPDKVRAEDIIAEWKRRGIKPILR